MVIRLSFVDHISMTSGYTYAVTESQTVINVKLEVLSGVTP